MTLVANDASKLWEAANSVMSIVSSSLSSDDLILTAKDGLLYFSKEGSECYAHSFVEVDGNDEFVTTIGLGGKPLQFLSGEVKIDYDGSVVSFGDKLKMVTKETNELTAGLQFADHLDQFKPFPIEVKSTLWPVSERDTKLGFLFMYDNVACTGDRIVYSMYTLDENIVDSPIAISPRALSHAKSDTIFAVDYEANRTWFNYDKVTYFFVNGVVDTKIDDKVVVPILPPVKHTISEIGKDGNPKITVSLTEMKAAIMFMMSISSTPIYRNGRIVVEKVGDDLRLLCPQNQAAAGEERLKGIDVHSTDSFSVSAVTQNIVESVTSMTGDSVTVELIGVPSFSEKALVIHNSKFINFLSHVVDKWRK